MHCSTVDVPEAWREDSRLHGVAPRAPEFDFGPASRGVMAASRIGREAGPNLK